MHESKTKILLSGAEIPMVGIGVWQVPAGEFTEQSVSWALAAGYRHIDTARIYGNEASVGKAVRESGIPRDEIFITTKLWPLDALHVERALERSLQKLNMEYVDLYLVHWPMPLFAKSIWKKMESLVDAGHTKAIGLSNYSVPQLETLIKTAHRIPDVNQVRMSPFHPKSAMLELCDKHGIIVEAYSPLTRGKQLGNERVASLAKQYDRSPAQVLLRWGLQKGAVVVPKSTHRQRIEENFAIFDFEISDQDMSLLDNLAG